MKLRHYTAVALLLSFLVIALVPSTLAQTSDGEPAEIVAEIKDSIPPVQVSNWTSIEITVLDSCGINWTRFQEDLLFYAKYIWPVVHPSWRPYLGYTSLRFEPEIISGNPDGWYLDVNPSSVTETTTGYSHPITLRARTDDSAVDYSIVVGIKTTRYDLFSEPMGESYIYVPLKASPANFIEIGEQATTTKFASPKSMVYFDVTIKNTGYYKDTFVFEIEAENNLLGLFNEQVVTMEPDETKQVTVGILTPEKLFDPGTPNQIKLYVASSANNSKTLIGNFVVMTQGMYISPLILYSIVLIFIVIIALYIFLTIFKDRRDRELFGKPDKPWLLPEEKKYLEELREKDKEKYAEVMNMMRDEYESSLLWYKSSRGSSIKDDNDPEAKGGFIDRLKHPLIKSDHKDETPAEDEPKKTTLPKKIPKLEKEENQDEQKDSSVEKTKFSLSSSIKGLTKKVHLPQKNEKTEKEPEDAVEEQKDEIPKEPVIDPEQEKLLKEKEEKKRKKEEAMKKIKKAQTKQKRKKKK